MSCHGLRNADQQGSGELWQGYCRRQTALRRLIPSLFEDVSDEWHEAATLMDFSRLAEVKALPERPTEGNYTRTMRTLLVMEKAHEAIEMRRSDMFDQHLSIKYKRDATRSSVELQYYGVVVDGVSEGRPKFIPNDIVIMQSQSGALKCARISAVEDSNNLVLLPNEKFEANKDFLTGRLDISFASSGAPYESYSKALAKFDSDPSIRARVIEEVVCDPETDNTQHGERLSHLARSDLNENRRVFGTGTESGTFTGQLAEPKPDEAEKRLDQLNERQRQAAISILEASCFPKPYILFGPPGTGKTHTLAETIAQIYVRKPKDRILYCANSNTCANQMVNKLWKIDLIDASDIFRLSACMEADCIGASRIIVTTNMKSADLMDDYEFDYVFVDEAAHAHELESLIPICCLKKTGCLVLAGDPKQLGPIVKCQLAKSKGLGKSLLERILLFGTHKEEKNEGKYDSRHITKLSISYRCDPRVLAISNKLFYEDELECANETPKSILKMMRIDNPLQFLFVWGFEIQPSGSISWSNLIEARKCASVVMRLYKMGITPDQIGVISAYKLQAQLITDQLETVLKPLRANLDERFQGIELVKRATAHDNHSTCDSNPEASGTDTRESELGEAGEFRGKVEKMESDAEEVNPGWVEVVKRRQDRWLCKIDTVDAFQGDEREIIIISTVRTPGTGRADFINDSRRFNVAVSRAKWLVFVVGHKNVLKYQSNWREFLRCAGEKVEGWQKKSPTNLRLPLRQLRGMF